MLILMSGEWVEGCPLKGRRGEGHLLIHGLTSSNHLPTSNKRQLAYADTAGVDSIIDHLGTWYGEVIVGHQSSWVKCGDGYVVEGPGDGTPRYG